MYVYMYICYICIIGLLQIMFFMLLVLIEAGGMAPEVAVVAQALFDHAMVGAQDTATVGNPGWMAVEGFCQSQAPSFWHIIPREWWILPYMDGRYFCTCHVLYTFALRSQAATSPHSEACVNSHRMLRVLLKMIRRPFTCFINAK